MTPYEVEVERIRFAERGKIAVATMKWARTQGWLPDCIADLGKFIRGEDLKSKHIEHLRFGEYYDGMASKIDELVDAVKELRIAVSNLEIYAGFRT
jgi:hypothetical protein